MHAKPTLFAKSRATFDAKGEHIYHLPGGQWYDQTGIDPPKGERWFCSETESQAAGWTAAK